MRQHCNIHRFSICVNYHSKKPYAMLKIWIKRLDKINECNANLKRNREAIEA